MGRGKARAALIVLSVLVLAYTLALAKHVDVRERHHFDLALNASCRIQQEHRKTLRLMLDWRVAEAPPAQRARLRRKAAAYKREHLSPIVCP